MSIAVMNWVWGHSPTSGNERLVLLALADACSRDDGTGCFPSVTTIAGKAGISDRTVRRVIARLEDTGHVRVHRGGGRTANSYTVVMAIHSPGRNVTPDALSGVTSGGRAALTQPCQPSPDITVSPDPPCNHHGTATSPAHARKSAVGDGLHGGEPTGRSSPRVSAGTGGGTLQPAPSAVGEFFEALGPRWLLTATQRHRLAAAVSRALADGWRPVELAGFVGGNADGVRNPYAVLASRLSPGELPVLPPTSQVPSRPPWCGICDERTRMLDYHGDAPRACPRCKPGPQHAGALERPSASADPQFPLGTERRPADRAGEGTDAQTAVSAGSVPTSVLAYGRSGQPPAERQRPVNPAGAALRSGSGG